MLLFASGGWQEFQLGAGRWVLPGVPHHVFRGLSEAISAYICHKPGSLLASGLGLWAVRPAVSRRGFQTSQERQPQSTTAARPPWAGRWALDTHQLPRFCSSSLFHRHFARRIFCLKDSQVRTREQALKPHSLSFWSCQISGSRNSVWAGVDLREDVHTLVEARSLQEGTERGATGVRTLCLRGPLVSQGRWESGSYGCQVGAALSLGHLQGPPAAQGSPVARAQQSAGETSSATQGSRGLRNGRPG